MPKLKSDSSYLRRHAKSPEDLVATPRRAFTGSASESFFGTSVNDLRPYTGNAEDEFEAATESLTWQSLELSGLDHPLRPDFFFAAFLALTTLFALLTSLLRFLEGDFELEFAALSRGINLLAIGDPSPVQASHPGPAENAPLLPT